MYKVFYNNSAVFIGEELTNIESGLQIVQAKNRKEVFQFLNVFLRAEGAADYYLYGYSAKDLFEHFVSFFEYVEAAGGLVMNDKQQYLFIRRFGIWDLPKGKMKKSELPDEAAIREVEEETMVSGLSILDSLTPTFHIYPFNNSFALKKTHWFLMLTESRGTLIPQQEEAITEAVWLDKKEGKVALQTSYRSLKENFISYV